MSFLRSILIALVLCCWASAQWYEYNPPGSVDGQGILQEVVSRCDEQGKRNGYDRDPVTHCHEATQQLAGRIRNQFGGTGRVNAFYVGGGLCCVLPEPRVTLQMVARYVAPQYRNYQFQVYFINSAQHWNNQPLFLLDEFTAYCNGSQAARELRADPHGTYECTIYFCHYADCLVTAVQRHDPQYPKLPELTHFVEWQKQRAYSLVEAR